MSSKRILPVVMAIALMAGVALVGVADANAQIFGSDGGPTSTVNATGTNINTTNTTNTTGTSGATTTTGTTTTTGGTTITPGVPSTGAGGDALLNFVVLLTSGILAIGGATYMVRSMATR